MVFRIDWHVDDDEWSTALNLVEHEQAGGTYDLKGKAFFLFLWGSVQFQYGLAHLFPRDRLLESAERGRANHVAMGDSWYPITEDSVSNGAQLSILDFANQLVRIVHRLSTVNENETLAAGFSGNEGGFRINFERKGGAIVVDSRLFPDLQISVPADEFMAESRHFLLDFIAAIDQRLPELLQWESLERLRNYYQEEQRRPSSS